MYTFEKKIEYGKVQHNSTLRDWEGAFASEVDDFKHCEIISTFFNFKFSKNVQIISKLSISTSNMKYVCREKGLYHARIKETHFHAYYN